LQNSQPRPTIGSKIMLRIPVSARIAPMQCYAIVLLNWKVKEELRN